MAEYIEREAVLAKSKPFRLGEGEQWTGGKRPRFISEDAVKSIPAADVVPVVHGRWVGLEYDGYADGCPVYDLWECSECGEEVRGEDVPDTHPWCHGCGARMDGE